MAAQPGGEGRGSSVIANVFQVLRCFTTEEPARGVTEIATEVSLHKSSVSRILATLEAEGVVEREADGRRYRLGVGLIDIAAPLLANLDVRRVALPLLTELRDELDETVALCMWDRSESVCIEQVAALRNVKQTTTLGTRYDTGLSATVQVFLAEETDEHIAARLATDQLRFDRRIGRSEYVRRLEQVRQKGFALNDGETLEDEASAAAPVYDHRGVCVAAVLIAAPRFRVSPDQLEIHGEAARRAAEAVSHRMGASRAQR